MIPGVEMHLIGGNRGPLAAAVAAASSTHGSHILEHQDNEMLRPY